MSRNDLEDIIKGVVLLFFGAAIVATISKELADDIYTIGLILLLVGIVAIVIKILQHFDII